MTSDVESTKRILVVEDDPIILGAIQMVLKWEGYEVDCAGNGREALDQLRWAKAKPDLILLDVMMPVLDGVQFRRQQKSDPALKDIPVVIVSGIDCPWLDASGWLHKPFQPEQLLEAIRIQA
jgi:CheY-like chemotaxis protein